MKKILITDNLSPQGLEKLREDQDWIIDLKTNLSPDKLLKEIPNYEALIVRAKTKVTEELIQVASRLKIIGRAGTGVDNIDLEAATSKGIIVMNTPGGNSISVAELTFGLILALARSIPPASFSTKLGKWDKNEFFCAFNFVSKKCCFGRPCPKSSVCHSWFWNIPLTLAPALAL